MSPRFLRIGRICGSAGGRTPSAMASARRRSGSACGYARLEGLFGQLVEAHGRGEVLPLGGKFRTGGGGRVQWSHRERVDRIPARPRTGAGGRFGRRRHRKKSQRQDSREKQDRQPVPCLRLLISFRICIAQMSRTRRATTCCPSVALAPRSISIGRAAIEWRIPRRIGSIRRHGARSMCTRPRLAHFAFIDCRVRKSGRSPGSTGTRAST